MMRSTQSNSADILCLNQTQCESRQNSAVMCQPFVAMMHKSSPDESTLMHHTERSTPRVGIMQNCSVGELLDVLMHHADN